MHLRWKAHRWHRRLRQRSQVLQLQSWNVTVCTTFMFACVMAVNWWRVILAALQTPTSSSIGEASRSTKARPSTKTSIQCGMSLSSWPLMILLCPWSSRYCHRICLFWLLLLSKEIVGKLFKFIKCNLKVGKEGPTSAASNCKSLRLHLDACTALLPTECVLSSIVFSRRHSDSSYDGSHFYATPCW